MYSPELNRFLQRDPKGYIDGINLYAYVKNNPLRYLDPLGLTARSTASASNNPEDPNKQGDEISAWWPKWTEVFVPGYGNYGGPFRTDPIFQDEK